MANQAEHVSQVSMFVLFPIQNFVSQNTRHSPRNHTWEMYFSDINSSHQRLGEWLYDLRYPGHTARKFVLAASRGSCRAQRRQCRIKSGLPSFGVCNGGGKRENFIGDVPTTNLNLLSQTRIEGVFTLVLQLRTESYINAVTEKWEL